LKKGYIVILDRYADLPGIQGYGMAMITNLRTLLDFATVD
jgi:hypothetical protein